jgi:hypothetical protein
MPHELFGRQVAVRPGSEAVAAGRTVEVGDPCFDRGGDGIEGEAVRIM